MIHDNILTTIGNTPVVRMNQIGDELECELFSKCEFFNPGGSIKDSDAIDVADDLGLSMLFTKARHFYH